MKKPIQSVTNQHALPQPNKPLLFHRIWAHSDLQLAEPAQAEATLAGAVDDLIGIHWQPDAIWCIGDAHCGVNAALLSKVAKINIAQLTRLHAPVYYALGNHELDLVASGIPCVPLHDLALKEPNWHVARREDFYFCAEFGMFLAVFFNDHLAPDGTWWHFHGSHHGKGYPYTKKHYDQLRRRISKHHGPVILASHYAFPGGQRPSKQLAQFLPLPPNARAHLYGHAHIGDLVWNKENPWQRKNPIIGDARPQINISALESKRSPGSHSALLELYSNGAIVVKIRCHLERRWLERFVV